MTRRYAQSKSFSTPMTKNSSSESLDAHLEDIVEINEDHGSNLWV